ncbi:uncharacterized protein LOC111905445 [Lactuca sativa]|uniref:Uncharacterized protein n=1 Tax=Lactuca sativa TaxID=4236 RepID=A0A9R1X5R4_LACSA|nr:uncharacterized protein LOC111905445 [Lactuca sativa]KAJ0200331.1 hypothetical protein LSAT_V11C600312610 [Lactuca sativa]
MGAREVYEEKLRTRNLYHEPTIKPGLGTPRCPRCLSSLKSTSGLKFEDSISILGIPYIQKHAKNQTSGLNTKYDMGFQISLNSVLHLTMLLQVPHITLFH